VHLGAGLVAYGKKLALTEFRTPGRPASSDSLLYRLIPAAMPKFGGNNLLKIEEHIRR
jgi:hypothetical protein